MAQGTIDLSPLSIYTEKRYGEPIELAQGQITVHKKLGTSNRVTGAVGGFGGAVPAEAVIPGEIGTTLDLGTTTSLSNGYVYFSPYTTTTAGTVRYGHFKVADSNAATVCVGLYSSDGATNHLLGSGTIADNTVGWINVDAGTTFDIVAATAYRLTVHGSGTVSARKSSVVDSTRYWGNAWPGSCSDEAPLGDTGEHTWNKLIIIWNNTAGDPP
jgi:hypothetical protein